MRSAWLWPLVVAALRACDSTFDRAEFARLQRVLSEHQHPPSCDRLLVFHVWEAQGEQVGGLGSQLRGLANALAAAVLLEPPRALVLDPSEAWVLADEAACARARADGLGGAWGLGCYFEPLGNCTRAAADAIAADDAARGGAGARLWWTAARRDVDWADVAVAHITERQGSAFFDRLSPAMLFAAEKRSAPARVAAALAAAAERDWLWWRAALYAHVFKPRAHVLEAAAAPRARARAAGWARPVVALHVRSGDRGKRRVAPFLELVERERERFGGAATAFLATDDAENVAHVKRRERECAAAGAGGAARLRVVYDDEEVREEAVVKAVAGGSVRGGDAVATAVANLLLLSDADYLVGSAIALESRTFSDFSLTACMLGCASGRFAGPPVALELPAPDADERVAPREVTFGVLASAAVDKLRHLRQQRALGTLRPGTPLHALVMERSARLNQTG